MRIMILPDPKFKLGEGGIGDSMVVLLNRNIGLCSYKKKSAQLMDI